MREQELDLLAKWEASSWAKKRARKVKRASMTDFDRFKVRFAFHPSTPWALNPQPECRGRGRYVSEAVVVEME